MAEEESGKKTAHIATSDDLAKLIAETVEVEFENPVTKDTIKFVIRPLTWGEDAEIDKFVSTIRDEDERARERMRISVWKALAEPKLTRENFDTLPVGLVINLAREIRKLSEFPPKA